MDQKLLWERKWKRLSKSLPPTDFAKKCYKLINDKDVESLVDLGSGDGKDSLYFASKGLSVTAVDFSKKVITILQKKIKEKKIKNIHCTVQNIIDLKLAKNSYDVVYAHLILHSFDDRSLNQIMRKIHIALKPNGYLFIKVKSTADQLFGKGKKINERTYDLNGQVRNFFDMEYAREKLHLYNTRGRRRLCRSGRGL